MAAQQTAAATAPAVKPKHRAHPEDVSYVNTCPACRFEDVARSGLDNPHIAEADLDRTTFLLPATDVDGAVCATYMAHKYPNAQWVGYSLDLQKLGGWVEGEQIVVVRRDSGPSPKRPASRRALDEEGKWETVQVPHEELLSDVVESAPIDVRRALEISRADKFTKSKLDYMKFVNRLAEYMPLPYRIDLPKHKDDSVMRFIIA